MLKIKVVVISMLNVKINCSLGLLICFEIIFFRIILIMLFVRNKIVMSNEMLFLERRCDVILFMLIRKIISKDVVMVW